jgi:uncharacterized zinc-type alcohol dehydrogenase-like protein
MFYLKSLSPSREGSLMKVKAYAAHGKSQELKPFEYESKPLGDDQIQVEISDCGICHSDIHLLDDGLGITKYPYVPGHEIVGTVVKAGTLVKQLKVGDRVGIGWQSGSCHHCEYCVTGNENCCAGMESTCVTQYGGYASHFQCDADFAVKLPEGMDAGAAAPLLCGGVTVYQPLRYYNVTANQKVAVVGIGGLGHLAVQFLNALGCEVTAISTSANKEKEAKDLGAHHFINSSSAGALAKAKNQFDVILNTVSADLPLADYVNAVKPMGKLIMISLGTATIEIPVPALVLGQRIIGGSWIGSPSMISEMLDLCVRHKVYAKSEVFPMEKVNEGIKAVRDNKVRYRAVLTNKN